MTALLKVDDGGDEKMKNIKKNIQPNPSMWSR